MEGEKYLSVYTPQAMAALLEEKDKCLDEAVEKRRNLEDQVKNLQDHAAILDKKEELVKYLGTLNVRDFVFIYNRMKSILQDETSFTVSSARVINSGSVLSDALSKRL